MATGCGTPSTPARGELEAVFGSLAEERWFLPLLSIQTGESVCATDLLGTPCDPGFVDRARRAAHGTRERLKALDPTSPEFRHATGLWKLFMPRPASASRAVAHLAHVANLHGGAGAWIDLSAAHLLTGAETGDPWSYAEALRATDLAVRETPDRHQAWFNRALALERLHLTQEAAESLARTEREMAEAGLKPAPDLRAFGSRLAVSLDAEPSSPSFAKLSQLAPAEALGASALDLVFAAIEELLANETACEEVAAATFVHGTALSRETGDLLLMDVSCWLVRRGCPSAGEGRPAIRDLADGRADYEAHRNTAASAVLGRARTALAKDDDSPLRFVAAFYQAAVERRLERAESAFRMLTDLREESLDRGYQHLVVRIDWILATMAYFSGDLGRSNDLYSVALERALKSNSRKHAARLAALLSEGFAEAGRLGEAFELALLSIEKAHRVGDPRTLVTTYGQAAGVAQLRGDDQLAIYFYSAAMSPAEKLPSPVPLLRLSVWRGLTHAEAGQTAAAESDFSRAALLLAELPESAERRRRSADLELGLAHARRGSDPADAADRAHAARIFYAEAGPLLFEAWSSVVRGEALVAMGDPVAAEEEYRRSIRLQESYGEELLSGRLEYLRRYSPYDHLVALQLDTGRNPLEVLATSERAKRFDGILRGSAHAAAVEVAAGRIRSGRKIIAYHALADRVIGWVLGPQGFERLFVSPTDRLKILVGLVGPSRSTDRTAFDEAAAELFDLLIRPADDLLAGSREVVFVPDKILRAVPFAALVDSVTGGYVIENHAVLVSPLTMAALSEPVGAEPRHVFEKPVVVADPAFSRRYHPDLPGLPFAALEAAAAAAELGGTVRSIGGAQATIPAFEQILAEADFLHFAGHAVAHPSDSSRSALVLAPASEADRGLLEAEAIRRLKAPKLEFVFLSACATSVDSAESGTPLGLVGAFLDLGARAVVGTLAPLDDKLLASLMAELYSALAEGDTIAQGLRAAQLRQLRANIDDEAPPTWAYLQAYRGH